MIDIKDIDTDTKHFYRQIAICLAMFSKNDKGEKFLEEGVLGSDDQWKKPYHQEFLLKAIDLAKNIEENTTVELEEIPILIFKITQAVLDE